MSQNTYTCQQAIFTSVRTPMGEGYRIIAASRGLRAEEKQAITRLSPSHNGLCDCGASPGVAFYGLPTGRLCVALSCAAGAEHTGRGGQRIYTHNVVIEADDLPDWGYSPFNILRAMIHAGLMNPQLKPPAALDELELERHAFAHKTAQLAPHPAIGTGCGGHILERLLEHQKVVLNIENAWCDSAEALLLGVPGPMREKVSFAAGLQFSISRSHDLTLLADPKGAIKTKVAGQPVEYVVPCGRGEHPHPRSSWVGFVERHWSVNNLDGLATRTSRGFNDVSAEARERVGQLLNCIDDVPNCDSEKLLAMASRHLMPDAPSPEPQLVNELLDRMKDALRCKLANAPWLDVKEYWPTLIQKLSGSPEGAAFAFPVIEVVLRGLMPGSPADAATAAYELASTETPEAYKESREALIECVLDRFADWADGRSAEQLDGFASTLQRWRSIRPNSPAVERLTRRSEAVEAELSTSGSHPD